jgi:hypothetical protein
MQRAGRLLISRLSHFYTGNTINVTFNGNSVLTVAELQGNPETLVSGDSTVLSYSSKSDYQSHLLSVCTD